MDLLERDESLAALGGWLGEAGSGTGRMVLVAGEAGVGKTSLLRSFGRRHDGEAHVWWGACDALSTPRPLGPLYDIARAAGGEFAALMSSDASRHERFTGFLDALASPLRPVVAVIEDLHWADEATRDLLVFAARRVAGTHGLIVGTYRDDEVGADHPLRGVLGTLASLESVRRLAVPRLSAGAVARLADGKGGDPELLYRVTAGNAFFVTEALAAPDTVPATVSDAVLARAARLSPAARRTLQAAAVVPDEAEIELVRAVAGDAAAIDECVDAGLFEVTGRTLRFRHELARLAVEDAIPATRRPQLHASVLAWLSLRPPVAPARLAYHAAEANDDGAVLAHAPEAAEQAARLGAHREAHLHLADAVRRSSEVPPRERAELLERYVAACAAVGRFEEALDASARLLALVDELDDVEVSARTMARRSNLLWNLARNAEAHQLAADAVAILEPEPEGPAHAYVHAVAASLKMLARDIPTALELGERARALAEPFDDHSLAIALGAVGAAQWFTVPDEAEETLGRAFEVARRARDDARAAGILGNLGSGAGEVRRYAVADRWLAECRAWCGARDLDYQDAYALAWSARSAFEQGEWSRATGLLDELDALSIEDRPTLIVGSTVRGRLRTRRGDPGADTALNAAWDLAAATGDLQRLWPAAAGLAELAWSSGRTEQVAELVEETFLLAQQLEQMWPIGELGFWLWRVAELVEPPVGAAEPFALQMAGDWRGAAAAWEELGCPYEVAVALADGDDVVELKRALEMLGRLGAAPMADRVAARLRDLGVRDLPRRPSRSTVDNPAGLTARQLEVLGLLGEGRRNAEIAAVLHISPKTVGHHVSAILAALGVQDRHQAAQAARELGISEL